MRPLRAARLLLLLPPQPATAGLLRVPAESNGQVAKLACSGLAHIDITSATFGKSCFGARTDGCTGACAANCAACTAETCPAVEGRSELGKCSTPDVTGVVASACDGRGSCDFPICIAGKGQPVASMKTCTDPPTSWPLGDPAYQCKKEFLVVYECSALAWHFLAVLGLCVGGYLIGGSLYVQRTTGARGRASLPHRQFWLEVAALVRDGVAFAHSRALCRSEAQRSSLLVVGGSKRMGGAVGDRGGGSESGSSVGRPSSKSGKQHKKTKQHTKNSEKRRKEGAEGGRRSGVSDSQQVDPRSSSKAAPAPAAAAVTKQEGTKSTSSGAGGRWVHVPA